LFTSPLVFTQTGFNSRTIRLSLQGSASSVLNAAVLPIQNSVSTPVSTFQNLWITGVPGQYQITATDVTTGGQGQQGISSVFTVSADTTPPVLSVLRPPVISINVALNQLTISITTTDLETDTAFYIIVPTTLTSTPTALNIANGQCCGSGPSLVTLDSTRRGSFLLLYGSKKRSLLATSDASGTIQITPPSGPSLVYATVKDGSSNLMQNIIGPVAINVVNGSPSVDSGTVVNINFAGILKTS